MASELISNQLVKNTNTITMEAFFSGVRTNDVYTFKAKVDTTNLVGVAKKTNGNTAVVFLYKGEGGIIYPKDGAATCTIDAAQKKITVRSAVYTIRDTPVKVTDSDDLDDLAKIWSNVNDFVAQSEYYSSSSMQPSSDGSICAESTKDLDGVRTVVKDKF